MGEIRNLQGHGDDADLLDDNVIGADGLGGNAIGADLVGADRKDDDDNVCAY